MDRRAGVIFDLDGVISDTQIMHAEVESEYLRALNIHIGAAEITARFAGIGDQEMFKEVLAERGLSHPIEDISKEKWQLMALRIEKEGIKPMPYALDLIRTLHKNELVLAIASGSPISFIEKVLRSLQIEEYFSAYVSAHEVAHGKPAPDVFLEAAKRASIDTRQCIIIEDGISGMQAAASANIPCIGLVEDKNKTYPTKILVTSLQEVTMEKILLWREGQIASLPIV